jgi:hypothetical protein
LEFSLATPEAVKKRYHLDRAGGLMQLAKLPREFFAAYLAMYRSVETEKRLDNKLAQAGWKRTEHDSEDSLMGRPAGVEHKYVIMYYRGIEEIGGWR